MNFIINLLKFIQTFLWSSKLKLIINGITRFARKGPFQIIIYNLTSSLYHISLKLAGNFNEYIQWKSFSKKPQFLKQVFCRFSSKWFQCWVILKFFLHNFYLLRINGLHLEAVQVPLIPSRVDSEAWKIFFHFFEVRSRWNIHMYYSSIFTRMLILILFF